MGIVYVTYSKRKKGYLTLIAQSKCYGNVLPLFKQEGLVYVMKRKLR